MTREDVIFFLNELRRNNNCDETIDTAIAALRGPEWVRTADRLPDGDEFQMLIVYVVDECFIGPRYVWEVKAKPTKYQYYIPMPKLPEVEE